jgi:RNA 2',3'-cyclic 3'-phosphodiesterase
VSGQEELPRRLFLGLRPPEAVLHEIERAVAPHRTDRAGWRWTPRAEWHVTVRFLGTTPHARVVASMMSAVAARTPAFPVHVGGFGAFPAPNRARTLWVGLTQGEHRVAALERALTPPLDSMGFAPERRRLSPHFTLCRIHEETDARMTLVELGRTPLDVRWTVDELVLFESTGGGGGTRYVPLAVGHLARPVR